ncbi:putative monooxygenase ydhR [Scopulibacillus darangshiensis]|uniref:Putative monooxygenase ydhR n=1 Tax=Scopulibacillus darangshiensis TaxID=442528 RepID=A0A4R2NQ18_9BACL|nr:YdhR family protein [Scopulibacillus darangshiensis]TCP23772.1 putative monooxygenase ydhR [Scopulibacillus darangshiensis]
MKILSMRFKSNKSPEELEQLSEEGFSKFRALKGLIEKYYIKNEETGEVGGIYLWENEKDLMEYIEGPIVKSLPERFGLEKPPSLEILDVTYTLNS